MAVTKLDINPEFKKALHLMENGTGPLFITGRAGTGKSTLLNHFRDTTLKNVAILAPTGVAAINVKGQTIHSFFGFKPSVTLHSIKQSSRFDPELYRNLDAIIIDEISMVRADLLDCVEKFLRLYGKNKHKSFGGIKMIFIGDLYQLPPVVTSQEKEIFSSHYKSPYFFSAKCFESIKDMELIELEKIYRQQDPAFINLLNSIRNKTTTDDNVDYLNDRLIPGFTPKEEDCFVYLTPMNSEAHKINTERLNKLKTKEYLFEATIKGELGKEYFPTAQFLTLKVGAQVMLINNDTSNRWVNGTMARITEILEPEEEEKDPVIVVQLDDGKMAYVKPHTWEISKFYLEGGHIRSKVMGSFTQYPLALAWAITIHKSQGKTFRNVILDIGRGAFSAGQVYVALSRCTSYEGLVLLKPILKKHIWINYEIVKFMTRFQYEKSEEKISLNDKIDMIQKALEEGRTLTITYLKANDEKSRRTITPLFVGKMAFKGKEYLGISGFCHKRREERVFRVDRILEMQVEEA